MRLESIFNIENDKEKMEWYKNLCLNLKKKYGCQYLGDIKEKVLEKHNIIHRHGDVIHKGKLKDGNDFTEIELSIICEGGFYHLGGESKITSDGSFEVKIYTD